MNDVHIFFDACRANGRDTSLRSVFPGRGAGPTQQRENVRRAFNSETRLKAFEGESTIDFVEFDRRRGLFSVTTEQVPIEPPIVAAVA